MRIPKNKKILITGGAGFIGSHLTEAFLEQGSIVTVLDKKKPKSKEVKYIQKDIKHLKSEELENFNFIFHLAGNSSAASSILDPIDDCEQNICATLTLLEASRRLKKPPLFVYLSSAAVYGIPAKIPIRENDPALPLSPYGVSKLAAERYVATYCENYGLKAEILRPFSVYGPGQTKQVIYDLIKRLKDNPEYLEVYDRPDRSRNFIYIDDLIDAILLVMTKGTGKGEIYNVASGVPHTLEKLVKIISQFAKTSPKIKYLPSKNPLYQEKVDISKLKALGFKTKMTFADGLKVTKEWIDNDSSN